MYALGSKVPWLKFCSFEFLLFSFVFFSSHPVSCVVILCPYFSMRMNLILYLWFTFHNFGAKFVHFALIFCYDKNMWDIFIYQTYDTIKDNTAIYFGRLSYLPSIQRQF
jgi:hypothetical protein